MRRVILFVGITILLAGIIFFLWAQGHAHWLAWNSGNPDLGRINSNGSDFVPFSIQLAIYEAGSGRWSSIEFRAPIISLALIVLGYCLSMLGTLESYDFLRLKQRARKKVGLKPLAPQEGPPTCPKCGSALRAGVTRCWTPGCTYVIGGWN